MSELFSEIFGCYFGIVSRILNNADNGITKEHIDEIIYKNGFSETAFHLLPEIIGGEWNLMEKRGDLYYSKFKNQFTRPATGLELSWLASLLSDARIELFRTE